MAVVIGSLYDEPTQRAVDVWIDGQKFQITFPFSLPAPSSGAITTAANRLVANVKAERTRERKLAAANLEELRELVVRTPAPSAAEINVVATRIANAVQAVAAEIGEIEP